MCIKCLAFLITLFLFQNAWGSQIAVFEQQRRDQTDDVPKAPYCIHNGLSYEERERMVGEIREFLWECWKEQQSGQVRAVFYTLEGDPTSSTFSIEQDRKGRWRVRVNSVSTIYFGLPKGKRPRREVGEETYDIVERVEYVSGKDPATATPLPDSEKRSPQTYRLRMKSTYKRSGQRWPFIM